MIYRVILDPDEDGYLGPHLLKAGEHLSRWPHVVFFRACMALYEYNRDDRIIHALCRHYLNERADNFAWRDMNNVEIILWLYGVTGEKKLLKYAKEIYRKYNDRHGSDSIDDVSLSEKKPTEHGVSHNEYMKQGAILYSYTKDQKYLEVSKSAFRKMEKFFMLPGGCICSNEHMIDNKYYETYETCDISDMTWSLSYLYRITSDASYGDKIERCIFNAGLGSVSDDFRSLQYFSGANQVTLGYSSNNNDRGITSDWMRYAPNPGTACCPGNVNRFMPNYIFNMWQNDNNTLKSCLFGPSQLHVKFDSGKAFISEETSYPFEDSVRYVIKTDTPFTLSLRVPSFAISMTVRGIKYDISALHGESFINCEIVGDETLNVEFEYSIEEKVSEPGVYLCRGPLVYSLPIEKVSETVFDKTSGEHYPSYNLYPKSEWRYALIGDYSYHRPSSLDSAWKPGLPRISAKAKKILNLAPDKNDPKYKKGGRKYSYSDYTFTPKLKRTSDLRLADNEETIDLLPYGFSKLRMTVFNKI